MVHLLQRPAGANSLARKMHCVLWWLILHGIAAGTLSAADVNVSPGQTKTISKFSKKEISEGSASLKRNSENSSAYEDFKPVATSDGNENRNSDNLLPNSHMSEGSSQSVADNNFLKRSDTIIPMVRFGRTRAQKRQTYSNNVIPYPRLGRSVSENVNQVNRYINEEGMDNYETEVESEDDESDLSDQAQTSGLEDYDTFGSESYENEMTKPLNEELDEDNFLSKRYGRSLVLFPPTYTKDTTNQKQPQTFVLPYPRPGRANRAKVGNSDGKYLILPYPRPGRFDNTIAKRIKTAYKENQAYMLPSSRLGRSTSETLYELEGKASMHSDDEGFLALKVNPFLLKSEEKNLSEIPIDVTENTSVFIIPYPRPGKKSVFKMNAANGKQKSSNAEKGVTDYVLPYPRPGKRSAKQQQQLRYTNDQDTNIQSQKFIVPYPRPGRSMDYFIDVEEGIQEIPTGEIRENILDDDMESGYYENKNIVHFNNLFEGLNKKSENELMLPYARLGRDSHNEMQYLRLGHSSNELKDAQFQYDDESNPELDYETDEDNLDNVRFKRSTSVVPYPRLGRSSSLLPYPRPGRSNSVVPYLRLGRSKSVLRQPKPKTSNSVIPYPRVGRFNSAKLHPSESLVPYPRPGRSNSVIPFPRPGRSDSVIPFPRPGRSDSVIPFPRPGRSNVVPYPRPGRSNVIPYPRPGRSDSVIPFPRPGRSYAVPYPRPGRSSTDFKTMRNWVIPNIRPGRSNFDKGDIYFVPRSRRTESKTHQIKSEQFRPTFIKKEKNAVIPYPRFGRSKERDYYAIPYPRTGISENGVNIKRDIAATDTVIPYPRLGRSQKEFTPSSNVVKSVHKLNKHMLNSAEDSVYLLPYPRPGRSSE